VLIKRLLIYYLIITVENTNNIIKQYFCSKIKGTASYPSTTYFMKYLGLTFLTLFCSLAAFAISPITGAGAVCLNDTTTLRDASTGGYWSSNSPAIASIGSASGLVTGMAVGTTTITYTVGSSYVTASIDVNGLPGVYAVTGGGRYCYGGTGLHIGISTTNLGIDYQLYRGGTAVSASMPGTTGAIDFGLETAGGTYNVIATSTVDGCSDTMAGAPVIFVVSVNTYAVTYSSSTYCPSGAGVFIGLSGSDTGVSYQLYDGTTPVGSPLAGTGGGISFGLHTAGTYTVVAVTSGTVCTFSMSGTAAITIDPLPTRYTVNSSGYYCSGSPGSEITLSGSQTGIHYQLYYGTTATGSSVAGTGSVLDMGLYSSLGGAYSIVATNATGCADTMTGTTSLAPATPPAVETVSGGGPYCSAGAGVSVSLSYSATGVDYHLYDGSTYTGTTIAGTGSAISFSSETLAGTYTVIATDHTTGCTATMAGSAVVSILPLPTPFSVTGGGPYCSGSTGVHIGMSNTNTGINYQLYRGSALVGGYHAGTGASIDFGLETIAGTYTVIATNAVTGCNSNMAGSAIVVILPSPAVYTVIGGGTYCTNDSGADVSLSNSDIGIDYQLYRISTPTGAAVAGTGTMLDFGNETSGTIYTVVATDPSSGCTVTMSGSVAITTIPAPVAIHSISDSICTGASAVYADSTTGGKWYSGNTVIATADSLTGDIHGITPGITVITYRLADGCTATDTVIVHTCSSLGTEVPAISGDDFAITPNPAANSFTVTCVLNNYDHAGVTLYDVTGRQVRHFALSGPDTVIPVGDITPGMYVCRFEPDGKSVVLKKIVIEQ